MNTRQETVLRCIIDEYLRTAEPVGSRALSRSRLLGFSPATVRNDMAVLEAEGYIRQPHISAGRLPTEKGYAHYIKRFIVPKRDKATEPRLRRAVAGAEDEPAAVKALARTLAAISGETVIVAIDPCRCYHVGLSNFLRKPESMEPFMIEAFSELIDRFDEAVAAIFETVSAEPTVMIGRDNPFGRNTAAIMAKCRLTGGRGGIFGLIGLLRMDYSANIGLIEEARDILTKAYE